MYGNYSQSLHDSIILIYINIRKGKKKFQFFQTNE